MLITNGNKILALLLISTSFHQGMLFVTFYLVHTQIIKILFVLGL